MRKNKEQQIVFVEWNDAHSCSGWHDHDPSDVIANTTGFLVEKTEDYILVASNVCKEFYGDYMQIPMCNVKKITVIGKVAKIKE